MPYQVFTSSGTWTAPADMEAGSLACWAWGESGTGGTSVHGSHAGAGSGGGAVAGEPALGGVTPGVTTLTITIGAGGTGTDTTVTGGSVTVTAACGTSASGYTAGTGGPAGSNTVAWAGGNGAPGASGSSQAGGGGGGSAGSAGAGGAGSSSSGGAAGTGAAGPPSLAGAAGASGPGPASAGTAGAAPGGGASGGGSGSSFNQPGGAGAPGQVILTWAVVTVSPQGYASVTGRAATAKRASGAAAGVLAVTGGPPRVAVVNAWTGTFAQPSAFGSPPPALQNTVIQLDASASAGIGSGTPSPGNWLIAVTGWNQDGIPAATTGCWDDTGSFWRPGDVDTSTWAVSQPAAATRTAIWYTANLLRAPSCVYASPSAAMAGRAVLVLEVAGLGPWDAITGVASAYAAAATSLALTLPAPSAPSAVLAAVTGDSSAAGQALTPAGWTALPAVTAGNGADHTCDAALTAAFLPAAAGTVTATATAATAADLSGVIIAFQIGAPSPCTGTNPAWPGRMICEAAFGSGFQTPPDQRTWTRLSDTAWTSPAAGYKRWWGLSDNSGVPYALGQLQSSAGTCQLDNIDGALSPGNDASPWWPHVTTGTPVRVRVALGTIAGTACDRWYNFERHAMAWPEKRVTSTWRGYVPASLTDLWSVSAATCPSPFRAEMTADAPQSWWPCDDQPLAGGVLPTSLRNAAPGNSNPLLITASPAGVTAQDSYSTTGTDLTALVSTYGSVAPPPSVAVYTVAAQSGWMYGDPSSSPATSAAGGPVTASPGAAAWQQSGLLGDTGSAGWFLAARDPSYPALSAAGATIEGWFSAGFAGSATGVYASSYYTVAAQPYGPVTLLEAATDTAPVAILQLDGSGHLNLITYDGATPATHAVYSASDLRNGSWFQVSARLTSTTWEVKVNAGLSASASGTAAGMPDFTWIIACGDLGSGGGSALSGIQHGGNMAVSHLAVFPGLLPAWREMSRFTAAVTGFGVLPAPTGLALSATSSQEPNGGLVPDGSAYQGSYGYVSSTAVDAYTFSAVAAAAAGTATSGPSARVTQAGIGVSSASPQRGYALWASWTSPAPLVRLYTAAAAGGETEAAACLGSGDSFTSGYGSGATGAGVSQVSAGTGAAPPSAPSAIGDTLSARIERILGSAGITSTMRAIDPEPLLVQAALDTGGQAAGAAVNSLVSSGSGLLYVDAGGVLRYRSRTRLAADTVVWYVGMDTAAGQVPFAADITYSTDPQKTANAVDITPYSPDGATLPVITPADAAAVKASQAQCGVRPFQVTSYLQDQAEMQAQADWVLAQYGQPSRRVDQITIDAAAHPAAWPMVLAANCSDIVQVYDAPFGAPASTGTWRISRISRTIGFGANGGAVTGQLRLKLDYIPSSYWT